MRAKTKGKLGTPLARTVVDNVVGEQMGFYLQENSEMSQSLIRKAIKAREAVKRLVKPVKKAGTVKTEKVNRYFLEN